MIDIERLGAWMDETGLAGKGEPIEHRFISGGAQNEIYEIKRGEFHAALRIPPARAPEARDKGIIREWRIIEALNDTDVPHTDAVAVCADTAVLGRAFYLMGFVDGWSPMSLKDKVWPTPFDTDIEAKRGLAFQLAEGIALLGNVDWQAKGLTDLGRPDGFHERQVARWTSFYEKAGGRQLPGYNEARTWLESHSPLDFIPGLMHGDYQFANVMFENGAPARLAAIVDWEMGTVGDPKLDLAWMLRGWPEDTSPPEAATSSYVDLRYMPTPSELLAHYSEISGRQVDDIDYYTILALWKLGVVLEQGFQRAGNDEKLQAFGKMIPDLFQQAAELAESTTYGS
ncbi:MAG: phosphotransferase family protein [Frankia sp.]